MLTISQSSPGLIRRPRRAMRDAMMSARPTSSGRVSFSSTAICAARSTRSSSPSA